MLVHMQLECTRHAPLCSFLGAPYSSCSGPAGRVYTSIYIVMQYAVLERAEALEVAGGVNKPGIASTLSCNMPCLRGLRSWSLQEG